ncbi:unnamed protein product [Citrullus colocynthis]|uniref:Maturase K n=1 Tax=Citrullus colocynthis TaxID=252529 RepID=A0ABP0Y456_9ROSI
MLILDMEPLEAFSDVVSIMHRLDSLAYFRCNPLMFSILIHQHFPRSIVGLIMLPQFFTSFSCDQIHYVRFSIDQFYANILHHKRNAFHSLTLCLAEFRFHMALEYHSPTYQHPSQQLLPTAQPDRYELAGKIDYGSFISLDLQEFRRLIVILDNTKAYVPFTITNSEFKFFLQDRTIIFTTQMNQCIIGGIKAGEEIEGGISLYPWEFYYNFTSKRLWLFKSYYPSGITMVAPMGLYANISSFFPQTFYRTN